MPRVQITLKDGSNKIVEFDDGFTDADIEEVSRQLNSQIKPVQKAIQKPAQQTQVTQNRVNTNNPYADILNNNNLTREQKAQAIQERGQAERAQIDKDKNKQLAKLYGGAALEIGSAAIPVGAGARLAGGVVKGLAPYVGRKIAQEVGTGLVGGGLSGAVFGTGRGLIEDKNPLKTAAQDALLGTAMGGAIGGAVGKVGKTVAGKELNKIEDLKDLRKAETDYYKNYLQQTKVTRKDLGDIDFTQAGLETVSKQPEAGRNFASLKDNIKNAEYLGVEDLKHPRTDDIVKFHRLEKDGQQFLIGETKDGKKYYMSKIKDELTDRPSGVGANSPKDIITDTSENFNPQVEKNLFGGEVKATENLTPEIKQSKLTQTMESKGTLPEEFKTINPEYEVLHNADIANQATEALKDNPNKVLGELQQKVFNKDSELSALDFETARQTISKLYQEGRIEEALVLTEQVSQKASKAGQSVQALSLWSKTTPEGAVRYAQKIISDYNKTAKKKLPLLSEKQANEIMDLAKNTQASEIGTRENDIANHLLLKYFKELVPPSLGNRLRTVQNISLLLNPKTFGRNIGGNSIFAAMDTGIAKPIAAGLDRLAALKTGQRTRVAPQLKEYARGLKQGFTEGVEDVGLGINTRDKLGSRFNLNDRNSFDNIPVLNQLEKALNYSLQVPDRMFYQAAYNESIANQLKAAGLKEATPEMVKNATNEALEAVFQNNSVLGNMALDTRKIFNRGINFNGYGVGDVLLPYAQTPANVAQQGVNYSPLGLVNAIKSGLAGNQRQATLDAARAITGTGLMGLGGYGAYKGLINPETQDMEIQKNYDALGIKPNTLNIGDKNISFNQLQPLAAPVLGGAATYETAQGQGNIRDIIDKSTNSVLDLGMLQNTMKFVDDLNSKGLGTASINLLGGVPSRFIPTGLKQINDLTDNIQRDTYDENPLKQGLNQAISKVPGVSRVLPEKYDVTGQPIKKYQTEGIQRVIDATLNPVFVNRKNDDPTVNKLIDLYETTGDKSVLLPLANKKVQFKDLKGDKVVKNLNARERNEYQKQLGVANKQLLDNLVNTEFYNNLDDEDKINVINTTQKFVKNYVDEKLWNKPSVQKRNLVKRLLKTEEDEIMQEIMKTYKNYVLPARMNDIYNENFD